MLDDWTIEAMATCDEEKRNQLLMQATAKALDEMAIIPLYFQSSTWAMRKGIRNEPRSDERTMAMSFFPE